jgi:imidazolonepropionase-like amidohydrolase
MSTPRLAALATAALLTLAPQVLASPAQAADLAIVGARIYPSPTTAPIAAGTVLIHDGRITAIGDRARVKVPAGATVIDGHGKVVTAGFWNSHVHIFTPALLHADQKSAAELDAALDGMLNRWGFTSVFDTGSILDNTNRIRARIGAGEVRGPMILTVGEPFYPRGGVPIYIRGFLAQQHISLPDDASIPDAVAREKVEIAHGADGVKLFTGDIVGGEIGVLPMDLALAKALVAEAHREHRPTFAHPTNQPGLDIALDSGIDILAHTADDSGPWGPALVARMMAQHVALIPTLTLFEVETAKDNAPPAVTARPEALVQGQLRVFHAAGGQVLFGTDVGYTDAVDTTEEFRLMAAAGLDWRDILASLTVNPAQRFGYAAHKGRLAPGMDADLVVLDADPAADVTAFAKVADTIGRGRIIFAAPRP